ncbi:MAG TPA: acetate--CoA ligase family protein, partial [Vicinamibacterales bacterium]
VAVKVVGPDLIHKSDVQGVHLNLRDEAAVRAAWRTMREAVGDRMTGAFVQEMAPPAPEFIVGSVTDRLFGPVVALGAGGTLAELMADVSFRLPPLSEYDVTSMLRGTRAVRLLRGFRGEPPRDEGALASVLLAVSGLVDGCPEIRELDLNPVRVYERGALVLDARIRLGTPYGPPPGRVEY